VPPRGARSAFPARWLEARLSRPSPEHTSYRSYATFSDPDGNSWLLQEVTTRLPGRVDRAETAYASVKDLASALRRAAVAWGARKAHRTTRRELAGLVRRVHGGGAGEVPRKQSVAHSGGFFTVRARWLCTRWLSKGNDGSRI